MRRSGVLLGRPLALAAALSLVALRGCLLHVYLHITLQRRRQPLRTSTRLSLQRIYYFLRLELANSCDEVYGSVDATAALAALTHKIGRAVRLQGVGHGRPLLRDWLVMFAANYHRWGVPAASCCSWLVSLFFEFG